jgi:hypothetical protein
MKLVISRNQAAVKGLLGGHKGMEFTLSYRLVLTGDEQALVDQYRLQEYPVTWKTIQGTQLPDDTIANMIAGRGQTLTDVTTLVANEEIVKRACDSLPQLFDVVSTFGGDEVVEYPRSHA